MHERGKIEVEVLYVLVEPPRGDLGIACGEVALIVMATGILLRVGFLQSNHAGTYPLFEWSEIIHTKTNVQELPNKDYVSSGPFINTRTNLKVEPPP